MAITKEQWQAEKMRRQFTQEMERRNPQGPQKPDNMSIPGKNKWEGMEKSLLEQQAGKPFETGLQSYLANTVAGLQQIAQKGVPQEANPFYRSQERLSQESMERQKALDAASQESFWGTLGGQATGAALESIPLTFARIPQAIGYGVSKLPKAYQGLKNTLNLGGSTAAESGLISAAQYVPEGESRLENSLGMAGLTGTIAGPVGLIGDMGRGLLGSSFVRDSATLKRIAENLEAAKGTETPLGRILENPLMNKIYESMLGEMPLSGARESSQRTKQQIQKSGEDLLKEVSGSFDPKGEERYGDVLKKALIEVQDTARKQKNDLYLPLNKEQVPLSNYAKESASEIEYLKKRPLFMRDMPESVLNNLRDDAANPDRALDFFEANVKKGDYYNMASDVAKSNPTLARAYKKQAQGLEKDIKAVLESNPALKEQYDVATKNYKENWAPWIEGEFENFDVISANPDVLLSKFLKKGSEKDQAFLLQQLTSKLESSKDASKAMGAARYGSLKKGVKGLLNEEGAVNPMAFVKEIENIGEGQADLLFTPDQMKKLINYDKQVRMNAESLNNMFNPKTGNKMAQILGLTMPLAGAGAGYYLGGGEGGLLGGAGGLATAGLGALAGTGKGPGKYIAKRWTDEKIRNKIVEQVLNPNSAESKSFNKLLSKELSRTAARTATGAKSQNEETK
jgi:hypothetical protein